MKKTVAALFVQEGGVYSELPFVDQWTKDRDAMTYSGPLPVVAHPPCNKWGKMARVNFARWGGSHNLPENDGGAFEFALKAVERWGGVLEHPATSYAFSRHGITPPIQSGWQKLIFGGWICEVRQAAYGHRANKATWLFYSGETPPAPMRWERTVGSHQVGRKDMKAGRQNKPHLKRRESNATPRQFRDELIRLALNSKTKKQT